MHLIRKYGNRKYYSPTLSRYVKLDEVLAIRQNELVQVICNKTKRDITTESLVTAAMSNPTIRKEFELALLNKLPSYSNV
jgi:polyhydroxyalkanoate synthesis regulator protein